MRPPLPPGRRHGFRAARPFPAVALFAARAVACAAFACGAFFAALSLWGLLVAPFVRLSSSSFTIVCALAVSAVATVTAYGAFSRWRARRHASHSSHES